MTHKSLSHNIPPILICGKISAYTPVIGSISRHQPSRSGEGYLDGCLYNQALASVHPVPEGEFLHLFRPEMTPSLRTGHTVDQEANMSAKREEAAKILARIPPGEGIRSDKQPDKFFEWTGYRHSEMLQSWRENKN